VRTAYKCRAYPDIEQASVLSRTFGCVRVVWNRTLAWRHARWYREQARTDFAQANAYLTAMKASEELEWLNEVSSVPLQQAIRHQQTAFGNFFAGRSGYPRYKSRNGRQSAECPSSKTCSACGHLLASLSLETRTWQCPSCGTRHDRDINAAKNILAAGLAVTACEADVRHSGSSRVQSTVKQETRPVTTGIPVLLNGE
jgi:transposase